MRKILVLSFLVSSFFSTGALAQAKNFEGFSAAANLVYTNSKTDFTQGATTGDASATSSNIALQGQYAWALSDKYVLALGAQLGLGNVNSGTISNTSLEQTGKNWKSLYLAPGYAINEKFMVYGKIASQSGDSDVTTTPSNTKSSLTGTGYGLGIQTLISKKIFIQAEYMASAFADVTVLGATSKYKNTQLSLGLGYLF